MAQTNDQISSYLLQHPGIHAALIFEGTAAKRDNEVFASSPRDTSRLKSPLATMVQAATIAERCAVDTMRIIFGEEGSQETIIYGHESGRTVVVIVATGDAIMKSIRRMLSRCMKEGRAIPRRRPISRVAAVPEPTPPPMLQPDTTPTPAAVDETG